MAVSCLVPEFDVPSMTQTIRSSSLLAPLMAAIFAAAAPALAGEKYALVVGVEQYIPTELPSLEYAEDDADAVATALERLGFSVIAMTSSSENPRLRPTTAARIREQVTKRLEDREPSDTVVLALSGHGVQFKGDSEFYFCPGEGELEDRSTLVAMGPVLAAVGECRAGRKLLLVDACRTELAPSAASKGVAIELDPAGVFRADPPKGTIAMFSCQPREKSYELKQFGHSVFTHHVVEYLAGRAGSDRYPRGEVNVEELVPFVRARTRESVDRILGASQKPEALAPDAKIPDWSLGRLGDLASVDRPLPVEPATPSRPEPRPAPAPAADPAVPEVTVASLVGKAVSDDRHTKQIGDAISRFRQRDIDGCRAVLERAKSSDPKLPPAGVMMAMLWLSTNQLDPAVTQLNDAVARFPADPEAYLMLADLAYADRRMADSATLFEKATTLTAAYTENPRRRRDFEIRCNAGNAAVAQARQQWETARKHLAKWIALDPANASARQRTGIVLFQLGKENEALAAFREAQKLDRAAVQPELLLARLHDDAGHKDTARKFIEAATQAAPNDVTVLLASAQWYLGQNALLQAKTLAERSLKLAPDSLDGQIVRGAIARVDRDYVTAERYFDQAHRQAPGNFAASNSLALVLIESAKKESQERALAIAEENVATHPEKPLQVNARTTLAWIYYRMGRREEAVRILDEISRNNELTNDGAYYVAAMLTNRGEKARARRILEEVIAKEPVFATRADAVDLLATLRRSGSS